MATYSLAGLVLLLAAGAAEPVEVPCQVSPSRHVLVRARINDRGPHHFIVDTGSPAVFLSPKAARQLNIDADRDGWGTLEKFELEGGLEAGTVHARVAEPYQVKGINELGLAGIELSGVLGHNLLARYRIEFDLAGERMLWTPRGVDPGRPAGKPDLDEPPGMAGLGNLMSGMLGRPAARPRLRGFLGIELDGIKIKVVLPDSPADRAGLRPGDVVTECQGRPVRSLAELRELLDPLPAGQEVHLQLSRGVPGIRIKVDAMLEEGL